MLCIECGHVNLKFPNIRRITPDLPHLTFPQLAHLLRAGRSTILALYKWKPQMPRKDSFKVVS